MLNTKYHSSNPSSFREKKILKLVFFVPMFQLVTPPPPPNPTPTRRCEKPNINALHLQVSEEINFEDGILCSYVPTCDPRGGTNLDPRSII